ncbi:MAG: DUF1574 domain-containing protein, partial [Lachnospiraceae bacterium]|nr:DUF1574 domain-containing protein [Lachnospiraceae bacterium]
MVVFLVVLTIMNVIFKPIWKEQDVYKTAYGLYEQPTNKFETIFVGSSCLLCGISPMELYEDYGICSYNLGISNQPVLMSYYWLEEAYRLNPDTLKTVVFDLSGIRNNVDEAFYNRSLDMMKFSNVKYNAAMDFYGDFWDGAESLIPLMKYHDRWETIKREDFEHAYYKPESDMMGYVPFKTMYIDTGDYDKLRIPEYVYNEDADAKSISEENMLYFEKMVQFCKEKDIKLVLIKMPVFTWSSSEHKSAQLIADHYDLEFIDFSYEPYIDEIQYNNATDTFDSGHMNYWGADKFTDWMGNYLVTKCNVKDVRENDEYSFMDRQLETYKRRIMQIELTDICDPCEYIERVMNEKDYTIFITVKDEASNALTEDQRERFSMMGLHELAGLGKSESYIAVINNGEVIYENLSDGTIDKASNGNVYA